VLTGRRAGRFFFVVICRQDLLSVQCNTLHGTEYKITCGVCVCVRARVLMAEYLENGWR